MIQRLQIQPEVSVIIPTFNRAYILKRAIDSVLCQSFQNFELIVVDDGSSDNTREVVESYPDQRIRFVRHARNRGVAAARNSGIRAASAKYIAFQDSDDVWLPEKLERQLDYIRKTNDAVDVVHTRIFRISIDGSISLGPRLKKDDKKSAFHKILMKVCCVAVQSVVISRDCFEKVGFFDERLYCASDWEMWLRLSKYCRFYQIDSPLVLSYLQPNSLSTRQYELLRVKSQYLVILENWSDYLEEPTTLCSLLCSIGHRYCLLNQIKDGREYFSLARRIGPSSYMPILQMIMTLFGARVYNFVVMAKRRLNGFFLNWWTLQKDQCIWAEEVVQRLRELERPTVESSRLRPSG